MRGLGLAAISALLVASCFAQEEKKPTYKMVVTVGGVWGDSWVETLQGAFGRLEGVLSAKMGSRKSLYVLEVQEGKVLLPSQVEKAVPKNYQYVGVTIELAGEVSQAGEKYVLTARGSSQKYTLVPNDGLKKLMSEGKSKLIVEGDLTEPKREEGSKVKPPPQIGIKTAKEIPPPVEHK